MPCFPPESVNLINFISLGHVDALWQLRFPDLSGVRKTFPDKSPLQLTETVVPATALPPAALQFLSSADFRMKPFPYSYGQQKKDTKPSKLHF